MSDRDSVNLIFHPGLSTAEQISNVSGRGVGMGVVKTNMEKIGGTVDVPSAPGLGTTVRMRDSVAAGDCSCLDRRLGKTRSHIYPSSTASDTPWPTPTHIVANARFAPVFCN